MSPSGRASIRGPFGHRSAARCRSDPPVMCLREGDESPELATGGVPFDRVDPFDGHHRIIEVCSKVGLEMVGERLRVKGSIDDGVDGCATWCLDDLVLQDSWLAREPA